MRAKNSVGVILQEPNIHHSPSLSQAQRFAFWRSCSRLFIPFAFFFRTFKKPAFQKEDGKDTNSKEWQRFTIPMC